MASSRVAHRCTRLSTLYYLAPLLTLASSANFTDLFEPYWAADHIAVLDGDGRFWNSSSTTLLMSSDGPNHNEVDFEFLGNVSGEPYLVQTNVYANGTGNREQRHSLWFDPAVDFHTYSILWNRYHIRELQGIPFPKTQPMGVYASAFHADDWAMQGGRVKTDWSHAPFVSTFWALNIDAASPEPGPGEESKHWWDAPDMSGLSPHQRRQLKWVRAKHLVYDYCRDSARFVQLPGECLG